jgi:zinc protease
MVRSRTRAFALTLAWLAIAAAARSAPAAVRPYAERVSETVLDNGLKVILLEDHKAPVAVFQIWYRVGSRNEVPGHSGLSHLLEHMMFKGTGEKVAPDEYTRIVQRNGGQTNAFTTQDHTTYFVTIASDRIGVPLDLEADRMRHLTFSEDLFGPERQVVMEERRLRTDNDPIAALFEQLGATAYLAHPYQLPIIGWMDDIAQSTAADLTNHYRTYYAPNNAFLVVVGDFDSEQLLARIRAAYGTIAPGETPPSVRSIEPPQRGERRIELEREAELPFVALAHHVPNLRSHDAAALEVLTEILAGGDSARLYHELVYTKRLARQAGADYDYTSVDPGIFLLYGQPLPGKSASEVEKALVGEIDKLRAAPPSEHEIEKAKNAIEAQFVFAQDSLFNQAMILGQYEIATSWRDVDGYLDSVRKVTAEDLQRVSSFYLERGNRSTGTLIALPRPAGAAPPETLPVGPIH